MVPEITHSKLLQQQLNKYAGLCADVINLRDAFENYSTKDLPANANKIRLALENNCVSFVITENLVQNYSRLQAFSKHVNDLKELMSTADLEKLVGEPTDEDVVTNDKIVPDFSGEGFEKTRHKVRVEQWGKYYELYNAAHNMYEKVRCYADEHDAQSDDTLAKIARDIQNYANKIILSKNIVGNNHTLAEFGEYINKKMIEIHALAPEWEVVLTSDRSLPFSEPTDIMGCCVNCGALLPAEGYIGSNIKCCACEAITLVVEFASSRKGVADDKAHSNDSLVECIGCKRLVLSSLEVCPFCGVVFGNAGNSTSQKTMTKCDNCGMVMPTDAPQCLNCHEVVDMHAALPNEGVGRITGLKQPEKKVYNCPECGTTMNENDKECAACGARVFHADLIASQTNQNI